MTHLLLPQALQEMIDAAAFYEAQSKGLSERFLTAVESAVTTTVESPLRWPVRTARTRQYRLHHFPDGIIYQPTHEAIRIVAVAHLHRRPAYWKDRLS